MSRFHLVGAALIATLAHGASVAQVQNGSFETGNLSSWVSVGAVSVFSSSVFAGWGATGSFPSGTSVATFGSSNLPATGVVEQVLATTSGGLYTIAFDYGKFGTAAGAQQLRVVVTDSVSSSTLLNTLVSDDTGSIDLGTTLARYSFNFQALGSSIRIALSDASTVSVSTDGLLDNVAVTAVPELPSSALMLLGIGGLMAWRSAHRMRAEH